MDHIRVPQNDVAQEHCYEAQRGARRHKEAKTSLERKKVEKDAEKKEGKREG